MNHKWIWETGIIGTESSLHQDAFKYCFLHDANACSYVFDDFVIQRSGRIMRLISR
jgi:hypothetical protein